MKKTFYWNFLLFLTLAVACQQEDNELPAAVIDFSGSKEVMENEGASTITIAFDKPVPVNAVVKIFSLSENTDSFQTLPAMENKTLTINIPAGASTFSFHFIPSDNPLFEGDKTFLFRILEFSEGLMMGQSNELTIILKDDDAPSVVSFAQNVLEIRENETIGYEVVLNISTPSVQDETITIGLNQNWDPSVFYTEPSFIVDEKLVISVPAQASMVSFKLLPVNNQLLLGHKEFSFNLQTVSSGLQMGEQNSMSLIVFDDELKNKPKSFETSGGGWRIKETYTYDYKGRIQQVHWESATPVLKTGTRTYYYDDNGMLSRINHYANYDEYFYHQNGVILKSEVVENGQLKEYTLLEYDEEENISGKSIYIQQPSGDFKLSSYHLLLYFEQNNLFSHTIYAPKNGNLNDLEVVSTRYFEDYLDKQNPFPVRFIPTFDSQQHLPGSYEISEGGNTSRYSFIYEFNDYNLPVQRSTSGETTIYKYY